MIIAIDFDGTIVDHAYPDIGKENPEAFFWMKTWKQEDPETQLILFTMRSDEALDHAVKHCMKNGIVFDGINTNPTQKSWTNSPKAYAQVYIDDAAFGCPLHYGFNFNRMAVDWKIVGPAIYERIREEKKRKKK